jgi:hypothetical protein
MHLKDPHAHSEMIEGLKSRHRVEECSFNTIFGTFEGHRIYASRKVAEKIEVQTRCAAKLYNWRSCKIRVIWPRKISFHAETLRVPSLDTSKSCIQFNNT